MGCWSVRQLSVTTSSTVSLSHLHTEKLYIKNP